MGGAEAARPARCPPTARARTLAIPAPVARLSAPLIARAERRINGATDLNVRADLAHLDSHLARVDRWIAHEVIGGEQPNAADLQIGSGLALLLTIEDVASVAGVAAGDGAGVRSGSRGIRGGCRRGCCRPAG